MRNTIHPNRAQKSLRGVQGALGVGVSQYDPEFLSAVAGREIAAPRYRLSERRGNASQAFIPLLVTIGVVVRFEVIDVCQDQGQRDLIAQRSLPLALKDLVEEPSV